MNTDTPKNFPEPAAAPASSSAMDTDVDAHVAPPVAVVELGGYTFRVEPMKVRQVFPFLQLARPIFAALATRPSSPQSALPPAVAGQAQGGDSPTDDVPLASIEAAMGDADWMLDTIERHGPDLVRALAVGVNEPNTDQLDDLTVVDLLVLVKHFVAVNAGFFAARGLRLPQNLPGMGAAGAAVQATGRARQPRKR